MGCSNCSNEFKQAVTLNVIEVHLPAKLKLDFIKMLDLVAYIMKEYSCNNEPSNIQDKMLYYYNNIFGNNTTDINVVRRELKRVKHLYEQKAYIPIWIENENDIQNFTDSIKEMTEEDKLLEISTYNESIREASISFDTTEEAVQEVGILIASSTEKKKHETPIKVDGRKKKAVK